MKVILSANVSHYIYTAIALQRANYLKRFICAIGFSQRNLWFRRFLPAYWQKKILARDYSIIAPELLRSIWVAELLQRGLPALGIISHEKSDWLNDYLFDHLSLPMIDSCDIFHFLNGLGLASAHKAKLMGSIVICDVRSQFPDYQLRLIKEEYQHLGLNYNPPPLLFNERNKAEYAISDYIIVASSFSKRTFVNSGYDPQKIFVVPYGVDTDQFFLKNDDFSSTKFRVLYVGSIVPQKGIHYLIKAFTELNLANAELLLIGSIDPMMLPYVEQVIGRNVNIHHIDHMPKSELPKYYNSASVFVLPSLADSWGLVVTEAMACGLPVIVTENTGSNEIVRDDYNGYVVPIRDAEAIQERLLYLYDHPKKRQEMGKAAIRSISEYNWERYSERLLATYNEIIELHR